MLLVGSTFIVEFMQLVFPSLSEQVKDLLVFTIFFFIHYYFLFDGDVIKMFDPSILN